MPPFNRSWWFFVLTTKPSFLLSVRLGHWFFKVKPKALALFSEREGYVRTFSWGKTLFVWGSLKK